VARVEAGHLGGPARADALAAVDQHGGDDGAVPLRLHAPVVVGEVLQHGLVVGVEERARDGAAEGGAVSAAKYKKRHPLEHGEDVARAGRVLAAEQARAELADGQQQVDVVAAHKVLRQVDDGVHERHLAVVVGRQLGHAAGQLRHLDLAPVVAPEAGVEHLALARLEPVDHARDAALVVHVGEEHQLLVHKVLVADVRGVLLVEVHLQRERGWLGRGRRGAARTSGSPPSSRRLRSAMKSVSQALRSSAFCLPNAISTARSSASPA